VSVAETKSNSQLFLDRLEKEILILDGAMGSMIYGLGLTEEQVRGERFKDWPHDLKNCTDVFGLTNPEAIVGLIASTPVRLGWRILNSQKIS